jgi:hypothetical protein
MEVLEEEEEEELFLFWSRISSKCFITAWTLLLWAETGKVIVEFEEDEDEED